jgi:hypothetical protein
VTAPDEATMQALCERFGSPFQPPAESDYVGIHQAALEDQDRVVYGSRYAEAPPSSGWYFTTDGGEQLVKVHVGHLASVRPDVLPFLGLAPGYYFDTASGAAAFDESLLQES